MKRILAIDTSTWWGGIALIEGDPTQPSIVAESGLHVRDSHASRLLPAIERLLAEAGWSRHDLDAYVATRGPGSFTGIRVGLGTLHGLALASGRPCFGVTTLAALAEAHGPDERERVPLIAAGRGEVYAGRFDAAGSPPLEVDSPIVAPEAEIVERYAGRVVRFIPAPGTTLGPAAHVTGPPPAVAPRGIAAAAGRIIARAHPTLADPRTPLTPVYVRPPDVRFPRQG